MNEKDLVPTKCAECGKHIYKSTDDKNEYYCNSCGFEAGDKPDKAGFINGYDSSCKTNNSTIIKNLKASIVPAIKLINEQRWEILELKKSLELYKSRENNLLKKEKTS